MSEETVSIYIRNSQKIGRVINITPSISGNQLYTAAAESHNLPNDSVRLIIQGKTIDQD
jgi:hypothetical protein